MNIGLNFILDAILGWFLCDLLYMFFISVMIMDLSLLLKKTGRIWERRALIMLYTMFSICRIVPIDSFSPYYVDLFVILPYFTLIMYPMLLRGTKYGKFVFNYWLVHVYFIIAAVMLYFLNYEFNIILSVILVIILAIVGYFAGGSKE